MEKIFQNKTAIVTGAASGIGKAIALAFALRGAKVVVVDFQDGSETVSSIKAMGGEAIYNRCDVSNEGDVKTMVELSIQHFGTIDFAVNNAGTEGRPALLQDLSAEDWAKTIDVDLKGVWLCMKYEIPQMLKQGKGAIVNTSSIAGLIGFQTSGAYVAAKHGVIGLTKVAALENSTTGIRVNAVCPGLIRTPMLERAFAGSKEMEQAYVAGVPMKRPGSPEEIAESVIHLCSDSGSYITGHAMVIDGGWVVQ